VRLSIYKIEKRAIPGKGELVYLFGRDETRKKHRILVDGHEPYFYVTDSDALYYATNDRVRRVEEFDEDGIPYLTYDGKKAYKIVVINSLDVSGVKNKIEGIRDYFNEEDCWEDDILYPDRVSLDIGLKNGIEIPDNKNKVNCKEIKSIDFYIPERCLFIDIETLTEVGNKIPNPIDARQPVVFISCIDSYNKQLTAFVYKDGLISKNKREAIRNLILKTPAKTKYNWKIIAVRNEFQMFRQFLDYYRKINCDFLCAWNASGFDVPYIINRMIKLNGTIKRKKLNEEPLDYLSLSPMRSVYRRYADSTEYVIKGIVIFDTMQAYLKRHTKTVSGKLDNAGKAVLGYGKVKLGMPFNEAYKKRFSKFIYYNAIDVIIDYEIFKKLRQLAHFSGIRRFVGVSYDRIFSNLRVIDFLFLSKAKERKIILPSARGKEKGKFGGGFVLIPKEYGRLRNMATLDLKSIYPGIMISFNIGFDTYLGKDLDPSKIDYEYIVTPNNTYFRKDKVSLVVECLKEFIDYRTELQNKVFKYESIKQKNRNKISDVKLKRLNFLIILLTDEQKVIKFLTNTIYGVFGNEHFRLYIIEIADTVTFIARLIIKDSINLLDVREWFVNYGDTDSLMYKLKSDEINDMINESYSVADMLNNYYKGYDEKFNLMENYIIMKPEDISRILFMSRLKGSDETGAKKRYIKSVIAKFSLGKYIICDPPEIDIKGYIRSSTSVIGNLIIKKVDKLIVEDEDTNIIRQKIIGLIRKGIENITSRYEYVCLDCNYSEKTMILPQFCKECGSLTIDINKMGEVGKYSLDKICLRVRASKNFSEYVRKTKSGLMVSSKVEHVDAGRWTNQWAHLWGGSSNLGGGSTINYIFILGDDIPNKYANIDKVALDDDNYLPAEITDLIDYDTLIKKTILAPLEPTLREIDITINDILTEGYVESAY